jgi:hypothetical protein
MPKAMVAHMTMFSSRRNGLVGCPHRVLHAGVIGQRAHAVLVQEFRRLFHLLARQAVDDAAVAAMLGGDEVQQLLAAIGFLDDLVADVGTVEGGHELRRIVQLQAVHDFGARLRIGGRGQRDARHVGELLVQTDSLMYSGRKSWPHCDTQCASSIANSEIFESWNRFRQRSVISRSGAT